MPSFAAALKIAIVVIVLGLVLLWYLDIYDPHEYPQAVLLIFFLLDGWMFALGLRRLRGKEEGLPSGCLYGRVAGAAMMLPLVALVIFSGLWGLADAGDLAEIKRIALMGIGGTVVAHFPLFWLLEPGRPRRR